MASSLQADRQFILVNSACYSSKRWWLSIAIALAALCLAHSTALVFRIQPTVSLWFPPAGVAVALTLWLGPIGALLTAIASAIMAPAWGLHGAWRLLGIADGIEPLVAWWVYRQVWSGSLRLGSLRDAIAFTLSAPILASLASATAGTLLHSLSGKIPAEQIVATIPYWWLGNALGVMAIAPPVLVVIAPIVERLRSGDRLRASWKWRLEVVIILALCVLTAAITVLQGRGSSFSFQQLAFLGFIPILWAAARFGVRGGVLTASYCTIVTLLAYVLAYLHLISDGSFPVATEVLQVHKLSLLVQCGVGLWVGTAISERAETQAALAVEQVRSSEYAARAQLSEQLMKLNDSLKQANLQLAESNREKDQLLDRQTLDRQRIEASELRLRTSLETMLDGVSILAAVRNEHGQIRDFRFDFLNAIACENYQMTLADVGDFWCRRFSVHCCDDLFQAYANVVETGEPLIREALEFGDRIYDIRAAKLEDGLIASWRDVTARQQAELALQQSKARFTRLAENVPGVMYQYVQRSHRDEFTYISPGIRDLYQLEPEAVLADAQVMWNAVHPDDRVELRKSFSRSDTTGQQWRHEWRVVLPSGELRWSQGSARAERQPNGDLVWDGLLFDITVAKHLEEGRKMAEAAIAQHAETLDLASDSIIILDLHSKITYWNRGAEQQYGWTKAEAIGQNIHTLLQTQFPRSLAAVKAACLQAGRWEGELIHTRRNGTQVTVSSRWTAQRDANRAVTAFLEINTDITARKQIEATRAELLAREQEARAAAETASRLKDEFLAIVSHELRSPLNAILGWAQLLRARKLAPTKVEQALEAIERNARAQAQLIEDLLDISRIVRGQVRLDRQPTMLENVVNAAIDTVRPTAETKGVTLDWQDQTDGLIVSGDAARLQQVVWNLLSNAIKFTPSGGQVKVKLELEGGERRIADSHPFASLTVSDTGVGISPDFLPYVFERFRQADSSTTRAQGGLGLGLAIVRNLVELHGGSIAVASPGVGQGATFTVRLPLLEVGSASAIRDPNPPDSRLPISDVSLHLLLVDDEPDNLDFLKTVLEPHNFTVTALTNAEDAFNLLPQLLPDVLISDISMPDRDGFWLLQQVRSLSPDQGGNIPAIALTAYAREEDRAKAIAAGFQLHIAKPVEPIDLIMAITKLVKPSS
ncbi:MASE1 domain-containing protein [Microcoleus sp. FACHB-1515]|uniref:MASE1 domain-containing protein n=1 Tax=Cyanophyceae TaxID=3028117 RepID=UPI00168426BD|nr:MASE1 domain-containing protein [Microcoleus sp. FACHB-1515]MBD2088982.1 MASE1 domain-containing protein [Microcoleus sp. FACHB-1515]